MTKQLNKKKAVRKLSNLDFSKEGASVALVGDVVGGAANQHTTLLMKSNKKLSDETIQKMQQVRVTLELPEFLQRFFYMWEEDAQVLAQMFGYDPTQAEMEDEMKEVQDEKAYIQEKLASFEILKSLNDASDKSLVIAELKDEDWSKLLQDQELIEKALANMQTEFTDGDDKSQTVDSSTQKVEKQKVEPTGSEVNTLDKGDKMTAKTSEVETVEKSALVEVEKALAEKDVLLQKALEQVALFEAEKKEAITKARFAKVKDAVKDEAKAETLFKALGLVQDEAEFDAVVKTLTDMTALIEKSALFTEQGATVSTEGAPKESPVTKALKAKLKVA